jgi:hypothetical protein
MPFSRALAVLFFPLSFVGTAWGDGERARSTTLPVAFAHELAEGEEKPKEPPQDPTAAKCVTFTTQARYIAGFDHLVHLTSACEKVAECRVSTNVNPKEQVVRLAPGAKETVLTFRGSPASTFTAKVDCRFIDAK